MNRRAVVIFLGLACLHGGCAKYYYQEGKSFDECGLDHQDCVSDLEKRVGELTFGEYEFKFMKDCMAQKGYKLVAESKLPLNVKRQDPDQLTNWRLRGLAGTMDDQ